MIRKLDCACGRSVPQEPIGRSVIVRDKRDAPKYTEYMEPLFQIESRDVLLIIGVLLGVGLVLTLLLLGWIIWRVRRINIPQDADVMTALRATPFVVVLVLDLLDFTLDILAAPFSWTLLGYLGLKPLRGVTTVESLIPGTQLIPTMTIAWIIARLTDPDR